MQKIRTTQVLNYVFMPGIIPRLKDFFGSGAGPLAFLIANIFLTARLLPRTHAYLNPANLGKFGIRDVFAEAGNHLVFDRNHLDQIAVFLILMLGFVLFLLQFILMLGSLLISQAHALPAGLFTTQYNTTDIAFELLDRVFGIPDIFNSCVAQGIACGNQPAVVNFPTPFNLALQHMFQYYSVGLLIVGVIIFLYYVFVVVAETAQTGTPFGKRFSHIWAPIRLVVAIGLLIPINHGLNAGQFIVLYAAKMGSGFATNGWDLYNQTLTNGLGVQDYTLYARPKTPDDWPLVKFMLLVTTCHLKYEELGVTDIQPYLIKSPDINQTTAMGQYPAALDFYDKGDVIIRFGKQDPAFKNEIGNVRPYCGEITVPTQAAINTGSLIGPYEVQDNFFDTIMYLWDAPDSISFANVIMHIVSPSSPCPGNLPGGLTCNNNGASVSTDFVTNLKSNEQTFLDTAIANARGDMIAANDMSVLPELLQRGWGGAGIWYNRIAEVNGVFFSAVNFVPTPSLQPIPMEQVQKSRRSADQNLNIDDLYTPNQSNENPIQWQDVNDALVANALYIAYQSLGNDNTYQNSETVNKGNIFKDTINLLFGTSGLFTMRENTDIHPLAQLVGLGKGIIDATVRNLFTATVFSVGGGFMSAFTNTAGVGKFMSMASGILVTITTISLTVGFMLYYVLPFLPFMYFFFAVGAWVKTIFEAMVGVPLWALGHLRIDGHGLPGENAVQGYYMIFEIFLRPILTVFGLIGGLITFTALAKVLNEIFHIVTDNLTGFDSNPCGLQAGGGCTAGGQAGLQAQMMTFKRDVIDEFFFTIIYTIIIYMMATASFKMIDQVPSQILRWMGSGGGGFADNIADAEDTMNRYLVAGAGTMTRSLGQAVTGAGQGLGSLAGRAMGGTAGMPPKQPTPTPDAKITAPKPKP